MSSMPSMLSYKPALVLVVDVAKRLLKLLPFKYSRSLLMNYVAYPSMWRSKVNKFSKLPFYLPDDLCLELEVPLDLEDLDPFDFGSSDVFVSFHVLHLFDPLSDPVEGYSSLSFFSWSLIKKYVGADRYDSLSFILLRSIFFSSNSLSNEAATYVDFSCKEDLANTMFLCDSTTVI
nr:hypothetical protein [Tanacetum cinerariifolium]